MDSLEYEKEQFLYVFRSEIKKIGICKFGKKIGIRDSNLSKALAQDQNPTLDTIMRVAMGLDLQIQLVRKCENI